MLSCLHILNAYLLTRRLIQAFFFCASILEFSYATTGALYMLSSHAQLALCLSVLFFSTWYAVYLDKNWL